MKDLIKKEIIIVASFVILCMLAYFKIPFTGVVAIFLFSLIIASLFYIWITNPIFKNNKLQVFLSLYYKMFFILALLFAIKDYPGKYLISAVALIGTVLYIIFNIVLIIKDKTDKSFIIIAILYIIFFSGFIVFVGY